MQLTISAYRALKLQQDRCHINILCCSASIRVGDGSGINIPAKEMGAAVINAGLHGMNALDLPFAAQKCENN